MSYDDVRWFDSLGKCCGCSKPATGVLRGSRNDSHGSYCAKCAESRLQRAKKAREQEAAQSHSAL